MFPSLKLTYEPSFSALRYSKLKFPKLYVVNKVVVVEVLSNFSSFEAKTFFYRNFFNIVSEMDSMGYFFFFF